ncbi:hypothetical protein [Flavobacterium undicola]|uniref:hypothetical protein n=1 Tax=Flavobacterium undicola TaxID=1932779 RepID=UPI001378AF80|nr:hypothetical protein [Flavobacterium undicola]MBA0882451.1 hypothetical protein [Flavobacterium undicola]
MKTNIKFNFGVFLVLLLTLSSCSKEEYSLGDLTPPSNIVVNTEVIGQDATHPNGDGSGSVKISVTGDDALWYKIDYDASTAVDLVNLPNNGTITKKYSTLGINTYRITVVAYGKGGSSTNVTKEVTVRSDFTVDPTIVTKLTNNASKTWIVDKSVPGHFATGAFDAETFYPNWWSAGVNQKVGEADCLYATTFTFSKVAASGTYSLQVATPLGAFTQGGSSTTLPGIPSGGEGCYSYAGATSSFSFVPASSGAPVVPSKSENSPSTQVSILLAGVNTYIGIGSSQKEYEILVLTPTYMYIRVGATEAGRAWYFKLIPAS